MKKALVILLTLAVAGGLFAQTFTWSGNFEGGIGMLNRDGDDDALFGIVSPVTGTNGVRGQLRLDYANANNNAGARGVVRFTGVGQPTNLFFETARAWVKPFGDMVEFTGGRFYDPYLGTTVPMRDTSLMSGDALAVYISPMDMLRIGVGALAYSPMTGASWEGGGLGVWAGLGVNVPSLLNVIGQIRVHGDEGAEAKGMDALFGLRVSALDFLPINAQLVLNRLDAYGDYGSMYGHVFVGLNVVENLAINLGAAFGMSSADDTDVSMVFGGWFVYPLGNIVPRLGLWYAMGHKYNYTGGWGDASVVSEAGFTYNTDDAYFNIRPSVDFQVANNMTWNLGGIFNVGLGDNTEGVDFGFFTSVRVNF